MQFSIADQCQKKDSACQMEIVSRVIDAVFLRYNDLPAGLVCQQDNTTREAKNQFFCAYLCLLCGLGVFRFTMACFLRPGHRSLFESQRSLFFCFCVCSEGW